MGLLFDRPVEDEDEKRQPKGGGDDEEYGPFFCGIRTMPGCEDDPDLVALARFAVAEHNKKTNAAVEFERLVKVRRLLVAGFLYYFTIEAKEGKLYEATVWEKEWENYKGLQDFKPIGNTTLYLCAYQIPAWHKAVEEFERSHVVAKLQSNIFSTPVPN